MSVIYWIISVFFICAAPAYIEAIIDTAMQGRDLRETEFRNHDFS